MHRTLHQLTLGLLSASIALGLAANVQAAPAATPAAQSSQQGDTQAQDAQDETNRDAPEQAQQLGTIEVTARRRTEDLQKVPIAISAFTPQDLRDMQAVDISGLQGAVPNLNIVQGRASSSSVNIFIRGIGQPDALQTFDPGVGFYVDDVYYSRIQGALFKLFDVDHVEVLRGPQGTLYGMNSTGGAIKIVTKKPSDNFQGTFATTVGNYGRFNNQAYFSGPLGKTVSASLAIGTFRHDGFVTDPATGREFNDENTQALRGKLAFQPSDNFRAVLAMDYAHQDTHLTMGSATAPLISVDLATGAPKVEYLPTDWDYHAATSLPPGTDQTLVHKGMSLHMDWGINDTWTLKSITAYRKLDNTLYEDIDATPLQLGDVLVVIDQHQFSQELQLHYDNHDNVHAVFGLYYLNEHAPTHQEAYADDFLTYATIPIDFLRTIDDSLVNKSYAAFANATWEFGDGWGVTGGVRYTRQAKDYWRTTTAYFGAPLSVLNNTVTSTQSDSWTAVTPSISLKKQFNPQWMWYVSANRGFKSGGFNGRANSLANVSTFDPEFVWTGETGMKFRSADGRMRASGDVFYSKYKNFQARVSAISDPDAAVPSFSFPVLNAAKLTMYGAEFQGSMLLGESSALKGNIGYLHAEYDEFIDPRVAVNPALAGLHDHVAFAPELTARIAATHTFSLGNGGAFTVGGDVSWRDDTWLSVDNRPGLMQPAYTMAGLFGLYYSPSGHWQLRGGVRNLTDEAYRTDGQEFSSVGNIQTVYYGPPRNYYVTVRYKFF